MTVELGYAFTVFFLTLGPIKTIPAFAALTADLDQPARRWLALRSALISTGIVLATALVFVGTMQTWRISPSAMQIAGGLMLFGSATRTVSGGLGASSAAPSDPASRPAPRPLSPDIKMRALSPLAVPTIITPVGVAAILVFAGSTRDDLTLRYGIYGLLALVMSLNLIAMLVATRITHAVPTPAFRVVGWIMSVLQAGLAVQAVLAAMRTLNIIPD